MLETGSVGAVGSESEGLVERTLVEGGSCTDKVRVVFVLAVVPSEYWSPVSSSYASSTISANIQ